MPNFEKCAKCGELLKEQYGAVQNNGCVICMVSDLRTAEKESGHKCPDAAVRFGPVPHRADRGKNVWRRTMVSRTGIDVAGAPSSKSH